jgi:hypothetical protein
MTAPSGGGADFSLSRARGGDLGRELGGVFSVRSSEFTGTLGTENELKQFLKMVRLDWSHPRRRGRSDIQRVVDKLKAIDVTDIWELLRRVSSNTINEDLSAAGHPRFSQATLEEIRRKIPFVRALEVLATEAHRYRQTGDFAPVPQLLSRRNKRCQAGSSNSPPRPGTEPANHCRKRPPVAASPSFASQQSSVVEGRRGGVRSGASDLGPPIATGVGQPRPVLRGATADAWVAGKGAWTAGFSARNSPGRASPDSEGSGEDFLGNSLPEEASLEPFWQTEPPEEELAPARLRYAKPRSRGSKGRHEGLKPLHEGASLPNLSQMSTTTGESQSLVSPGRENDAGSALGSACGRRRVGAALSGSGGKNLMSIATVAHTLGGLGCGCKACLKGEPHDKKETREPTVEDDTLYSQILQFKSQLAEPFRAAPWKSPGGDALLQHAQAMLKEQDALNDRTRLYREIGARSGTASVHPTSGLRSHVAKNIRARLKEEEKKDRASLDIQQQIINIRKDMTAIVNARREMTLLRKNNEEETEPLVFNRELFDTGAWHRTSQERSANTNAFVDPFGASR